MLASGCYYLLPLAALLILVINPEVCKGRTFLAITTATSHLEEHAMAPSSRTRASRGHVQPATKTNVFRVTKSAKLNAQPQTTKQKLHAIEEAIEPVVQVQVQIEVQPTVKNKKRRHDTLESDLENEAVTTRRPLKAARKARPASSIAASTSPDRTRQTLLQLQTPSWLPKQDVLPATLEELIAIHKAFTQALGVHYAHNGTRNSVPLATLLPSVTRLWKRRAACLQDIQRVLAVWEIRIEPSGTSTASELEHKKGPFRLLTTGIGASSQVKVEYAWTESRSFIESQMHQKFEHLVQRWCTAAVQNDDRAGTFEELTNLPLLKCSIGEQTQARKEKINSIKNHILSKPGQTATPVPHPPPQPQSLDLSKLDISDPSEPKPTTRETALKSRTLSLFDRLKAKQLATSASTQPTPSDLLRRRALHRLPEIIDVLRLKQARKLSSQFRAENAFANRMKVSFSLDALVQEIRDSGKTNIAAEEVRESISILGREVPDSWCCVYVSGDVQCVTLQGEGWRKDEVREWCEKEIARIEGK